MSAWDTSGSAPQHSHPHNNTMSRNEKFWVDQVTVPPPPGGNDKGWGMTRGGGATLDSGIAVHSNTGIQMWISWTLGLQSIAQISTNKYDSGVPVFQQTSSKLVNNSTHGT